MINRTTCCVAHKSAAFVLRVADASAESQRDRLKHMVQRLLKRLAFYFLLPIEAHNPCTVYPHLFLTALLGQLIHTDVCQQVIMQHELLSLAHKCHPSGLKTCD